MVPITEKDVGYVYRLRAGEDLDCDCGSRAVVRITEKSGMGISYGYYCKSCQPEAPVQSVTPTTSRSSFYVKHPHF